MWQNASLNTKLSILEGETLITASLMQEHPKLMKMLRDKASKEECLKYIDNNF